MATLSEAVSAVLVTAFAGPNAALPPTSADRISVYDALIPGVPTNRYAVVYAGEPRRGNSSADGSSRDAAGRFQVTVAATRGDSDASPAPHTARLVKATLDALVDATLTVDGMQPFRVQQDDVDTYPVPVEVVKDRVTVEHALLFKYASDLT